MRTSATPGPEPLKIGPEQSDIFSVFASVCPIARFSRAFRAFKPLETPSEQSDTKKIYLLIIQKDFSEEPTTYTVVAETADEAREEEVAPKAMAISWAEQLKTQIKSKHYPDIDPRTAAHELNGYKTALRDLGLLDAEEAFVGPDAFGEACELYTDEGHHVDMMLPSRAGLAIVSPHDYEEGETFTGCTVQTLKCRRCGRESFAWSKGPALGPEQEEALSYVCDEVLHNMASIDQISQRLLWRQCCCLSNPKACREMAHSAGKEKNP